MVQARQFRKSHEDTHYAAAVFRYQRELAVRYGKDASFVCMDDKHRIKVGEPKYPVAATRGGTKLLTFANQVANEGLCCFRINTVNYEANFFHRSLLRLILCTLLSM